MKGKEHRLKTRKQSDTPLGLPLNFLLGCSQQNLDSYALARLGDIADTRKELLAVMERLVLLTAQSIVAELFRKSDRASINRDIATEESPIEWAKRKIREGQRSKEELEDEFLPGLPLGAAHLAAAMRYQERNIAEGKCQNCPQPLDPASVRFCTKHLAAERNRHQKKGKATPGSREYLYSEELQPSEHGRQPGTLASLAINREKATRALCAEMGIPFESAAVTLKAAKQSLLAHIPQSAKDGTPMPAAELFTVSLIPSVETGRKALRELLAEGLIQSKGKGIKGDPFLYWKVEEKLNRPISSKLKNQVLLQTLRGEEPGQ